MQLPRLGLTLFMTGCALAAVAVEPLPAPKHVLIFTKSSGYEHDAIKLELPGGRPGFAFPALEALGRKNSIEFTMLKDGSVITEEYLAQFDAYLFYTSGDIMVASGHPQADGLPPLTPEGKAALLAAIAGGKGFIGVHSATDNFHTAGRFDHVPERFLDDGAATDAYVKMIGAEFIRHGKEQIARLTVIDPNFPGLAAVPAGYAPVEEWYSLKNFSPDMHVLLVQETAGMTGAEYKRPAYPCTWVRREGKGRVFYTSLGHREDIWTSPVFQSVLEGGLNWALGRVEADITPNLATAAPGANELPAYVPPAKPPVAAPGAKKAALVSPPEFQDWPAGASPWEIGLRVAENFSTHPFEWQGSGPHGYVIYPEVCAWYGSLTVAKLTGSTGLQQRLLAKYDPLLLPENVDKLSPKAHVDDRIFGVVPLEFHLQQLGDRWLAVGRRYADAQWEKPTPDGITAEARYWIDDMYMSPILQVQAFRATGDQVYLDRAALMMVAYLDKLQQPTGLFLHASDSPFYWGRGNGWVAAGMTELLRELPPANPHHARILAGYRLMMAALLANQGSDGLWKQLVDKPESWGETSGTGMFTFAIVTGVREGWLDAKAYAPAARKAWLALVNLIDADANLREICVGTNKAKMVVGEDLQKQYEFYLARPRRTGDLHGQAPLLWTASAFLH